MNDNSLPAGDRLDAADAAPEPLEHRPASVIRMNDGSYFRAWKARMGYFSVQSVSRARLYFAGDRETITRTVARLARKGFAVKIVAVKVNVGQAQSRSA